MLSKLFFNMLPVQMLIFAMGSVNSIIDGAIAGRYIGSAAVGVIGLYYSFVCIINAVSSVMVGGTSVLCGKYIGKGDVKKTDGIFSLNLTVTFVIAAILAVGSFVIPGIIADILGATSELKGELISYITGYGIGIIPMLLSQQIAAFLQMERQSTRGYVGAVALLVSNIGFDILFVAVLNMGVWGLALATSFTYIIYFIVLASYYLTPRAQLHFNVKNALWEDLAELIKIGFPGALLVFCLSLRGMVMNRILLKYAGNDGLSAMSAFNMVNGFLIAYCLGNGTVLLMLISVFVGEEDKVSMRKAVRLVMTKGLAISVVFAAIVVSVSSYISLIFFPDRTSAVYQMNHQLLIVFGCCIPLILIIQICTNYFQAIDHKLFVNIMSVIDGFFAMVIPALILAPRFGAIGIWMSIPIGIIFTILLVPIYKIIFWKHAPRNIDEGMLLTKHFGVSEGSVLDIAIHDEAELVDISQKAQDFCLSNGMGKKTSYYAALCIEEMAGNVIRHGFNADNKKHSLNIMMIFKDDTIVLRIKDDCIPFNPIEMAEATSDSESGNIGIRMIYKIADDISYQNMLGLNILTVKFREKNIILDEKEDYLLEKTLNRLDKGLHRIFRDTILATQMILSKYKLLFPEYTDHTELHSMTVVDSCGRLIGSSQIDKLNADEIYILLAACYFHDVGMGVSDKDYEEFAAKLEERSYFEVHPNDTRADFVRTYHHEFSGLFIEKYADLFDIPSPEHLFAIKQVSRGHRKTDLYDERTYPTNYKLPNGNTVCLPYLAALIRLADEIDVVATRNPLVLYDIDDITDEIELVENKKLMAVQSMYMTESAFVLSYLTDDENIAKAIEEMVVKMQKTLDYCRDVVHKRTDFTISQSRVITKRI